MAEIITVLGYAGSGKTTHCERVASEGLGGIAVHHISVGNRKRAIQERKVVSEFSDYINAPDVTARLPDEVVTGMVFEAIDKYPHDSLILSDGFPRFFLAVEGFQAKIEQDGHSLLGTIHLNITQPTSVERVLARGPRYAEPESSEVQESHANWRYDRDRNTTNKALLMLNRIAPIETVDAGGSLEEVYLRFTAALGNLALKNS